VLRQHDPLHAQQRLLLHLRVGVGHEVHDQLLAMHARHDEAALGVELDELPQVVAAYSKGLGLQQQEQFVDNGKDKSKKGGDI